jgi:hypothetical protein
MNKKIYYEIDAYRCCLTPCSRDRHVMVGSAFCWTCQYNQNHGCFTNETKEYIFCDYDNKFVIDLPEDLFEL